MRGHPASIGNETSDAGEEDDPGWTCCSANRNLSLLHLVEVIGRKEYPGHPFYYAA